MSHVLLRRPLRSRILATAVFLVFLVGSIPCPAFAAEQQENGALQQTRVRAVPSEGPALGETGQEPGWSYNSDYIFAVSRALRDSTLPPAGKVPLFVLTIPLDTVLLPFSLLAGLLGE